MLRAKAIFPPVADLLAYRCGSLDCHGSIAAKLHHLELLRPPARHGRGAGLPERARVRSCLAEHRRNVDTTAAEYNATYRSLVGLEPTVMSQVVASGGADPDLLTFVRKARGEEDHKGGKLWDAGSPDDQCVAQWLAGQSSTTATCRSALGLDLDAGLL